MTPPRSQTRSSSPRPVRSPRATTETPPRGEGRVVIEGVAPEIDAGASAAKRIVGDVFTVEADIFSDGHDVVRAELLYRPADEARWRRTPMAFAVNDRWAGSFPLDRNTRWLYTIEGWRDPFASWARDVAKKRDAGQDVTSELTEGEAMLRAVEPGPADAAEHARLLAALDAHPERAPGRIDALLSPATAAFMGRLGERANLSRYPRTLPVVADRLAARFSAWYELFPRSQSDDPVLHGTFDDVIGKLPYVRDLGFDVLYFTPIHPIGRTNRKGRNNALTAGPNDPGSVYAIGAEEGGHTAVHPELGTLEDFDRLVAAARDHGLEIALDFAVQCSPDHPWIKEHPEWFEWRPDGTIRFAENPPKKYEDIVNVHFYGQSFPDLWYALRDAFVFWIERGVKIFRVDNPHTKPIPFWEWVIRDINERHPDVLFLAEAFTRPKMMKKLAKIGFQQSYTYFTWRNEKWEIAEYALELAGEMGEYYRPNFFVNTPDINPVYLHTSGRPGFVVRSTLAATLSSVWGMYSGFEVCEATPILGKEEYLDSEKYEIKARDLDKPGHIKDHIRALNRIRRENPALQDFRNVTFLNAWNDTILAYAKWAPDKSECVLCLVNLDPHARQDCAYEIPLWEFGLPDTGALDVEDLLLGYRFTLHGKTHQIALDPIDRSVAVWRLRKQG